MTLRVIGVGVGRTGTYSLKLALEQLGLGPCFHMEEVIKDMPRQVPLWNGALDGNGDWSAIYDGFNSAVDWPTAGFSQELAAAYPDARFILTHRDPGTWADSFGSTIHTIIKGRADAPPEMQDWLAMAARLVMHSGFNDDMDRDGLAAAFAAHNDAVRAAIPAERLLVYQVKEGWGPLCDFLGVDNPGGDFPRTNDRTEFFDLVQKGAAT